MILNAHIPQEEGRIDSEDGQTSGVVLTRPSSLFGR